MKITLNTNTTSAEISTKGAELIRLEKNNKNYIWTVNETYWNKTSPVLFPIVGRLKNDEYVFENKTYKMNRHGFARDYEFDVISKTDNSVIFSLKENESTLKIYPFAFELQIIYTLKENGLTVEYLITNNNSSKMFFNIGAHPAFSMPENFKDYSLVFEEDRLEVSPLQNDLFGTKKEIIELKNRELQLDYELFKNDALVFKSAKTRKLVLKHKDDTILIFKYDDFSILGIWTKENAPFLCIEPWNGNADLENTSGKIENKENVQWLEPNATYRAHFEIQV